ncbi:MAG: hypothetical protein RR086_03960, partial [Clostridia bacterium]
MSGKKKAIIALFCVVLIIGIAVLIAWLVGGASAISEMFQFVSSQILGMKWLDSVLGLAFIGIFGEEFMLTIWGKAIQFFIYDSIKIIFLLCFLIFIVSYIQSYFPPER